MQNYKRKTIIQPFWQLVFKLAAMLLFCVNPAYSQNYIAIGKSARDAINRNSNRLEFAFADKGAKFGANVYLRIFKDKSIIELWAKAKDGKYKYIRQYRICGNNVTNIPTGIYAINAKNLAQYEGQLLRVGTNFPNAYNLNQKQNGKIEIAPRCSSAPNIGVTDTDAEEIFTILHKSISSGQNNVQIHIYPFALNALNMFTANKKANYNTLKQLEPIYSNFEREKKLPQYSISAKGYAIIKNK
jgi:murein L,D-transpeptidase YafK